MMEKDVVQLSFEDFLVSSISTRTYLTFKIFIIFFSLLNIIFGRLCGITLILPFSKPSRISEYDNFTTKLTYVLVLIIQEVDVVLNKISNYKFRCSKCSFVISLIYFSVYIFNYCLFLFMLPYCFPVTSFYTNLFCCHLFIFVCDLNQT